MASGPGGKSKTAASAAAAAMEDAESRFLHFLQPIRDLTKNWEVDVATQLGEYLEEVGGGGGGRGKGLGVLAQRPRKVGYGERWGERDCDLLFFFAPRSWTRSASPSTAGRPP